MYDYLKDSKYDIKTIKFPLIRSSRNFTVVERKKAARPDIKTLKFPRFNFPPFTYILDLFSIVNFSKFDFAVAFNPLAAVIARLMSPKRAQKILLYSIDFHEKKYKNIFLNFTYFFIEYIAFSICDMFFEVSKLGLDSRIERYPRLRNKPNMVVPIGYSKKLLRENRKFDKFFRIAYFGALDDRNGTKILPEIAKNLKKLEYKFLLEIIGTGPNQIYIENYIKIHNLLDVVKLHGYQKDESAFDILSECSLGLAPYTFSDNFSFSKYSDPGKLKAYAFCGLPILTSSINFMSHFYVDNQAAIVVENNSVEDWVDKIVLLLENKPELNRLSEAAVKIGINNTQEIIYDEFFEFISRN